MRVWAVGVPLLRPDLPSLSTESEKKLGQLVREWRGGAPWRMSTPIVCPPKVQQFLRRKSLAFMTTSWRWDDAPSIHGCRSRLSAETCSECFAHKLAYDSTLTNL